MSAPFTLAEELAPILQQISGLEVFLRCGKEEHNAILADQEQLQREILAHRKVSEVTSRQNSFQRHFIRGSPSRTGLLVVLTLLIYLPSSPNVDDYHFAAAVSESSLLPRIHFTRKRKAHDSQVEVGQSSAGNISILQFESNKSIVTSKRSRGIPTGENRVFHSLKRV
ncbi:hypothetical protein EDD18DRAFT_1466880 [Armillaria luteobubalina]|uniref:Uncharacterized protein n=1 Tax=Armillaria luteobubalina TaxID=153913 RepID=A0AA39PLU5_9AGAR|nr:hypothetical protein EDD18DRAFT_1466880 [Armillaria luteobubalina]